MRALRLVLSILLLVRGREAVRYTTVLIPLSLCEASLSVLRYYVAAWLDRSVAVAVVDTLGCGFYLVRTHKTSIRAYDDNLRKEQKGLLQ